MWRIELNRLIRSKGLYLSLGIGMALAIWHFLKWDLPVYQMWEQVYDFSALGEKEIYIPTAYEMWMNNDVFSTPEYLFLLFIPILAVLPYAMTYHIDRTSGWMKNLNVRMERARYMRMKLIMIFLSGMVTVMIPLIVQFLMVACCFPLKHPQLIGGYTLVGVRNIWYVLFYTHPLIYTMLFVVLNGIYGGMMAVLSMFLAHATNKGILVGIMPFIYHLFLFSFLNLIGHAELSPMRFLNGETSCNYWIQYLTMLMITLLLIVITYRQGKECDVY